MAEPGDLAAQAGLDVVTSAGQSVNQGARNHNTRGDELANHMLNGGHPWAKITGKPTTFAPSGHTLESHTGSLGWSRITGKPASYPPSGHNHDASQITGGVLTRPVASPSDLAAEGTVYAAGRFRSPGSRGWTVVSNYASIYADGDGWFGISPSARRFKRDIRPVEPTELDPAAVLAIEPVWYRLHQEADDSQPHLGFIAEDLVAAGLGAIVPVQATPGAEDYGLPVTINYELFTVAQQVVIRHLAARVAALEAAATAPSPEGATDA